MSITTGTSTVQANDLLSTTSGLSLGDALERLPKVEIHCHVEGAIRPTTVIELLKKNGLALPTEDPTELFHYTSLTTFLDVFFMIQESVGAREDWTRIAYESMQDGLAHGRVYAEMFFTPARLLDGGQTLADIVAGLDEGLRAAETDLGGTGMMVCDVDRAYGPGPALELATELARLRAEGAPGMDRVIGMGLDSTEIGVDPKSFVQAFDVARAAGFRITAQQGEDSGPDAIRDAVDVLGAERIDHGITLGQDPDLLARFIDEQIPLTMCPNSNIRIANRYERLEDHPLAGYRDAGVLATVNTDDPALTDLDLGYEYRTVAQANAWGWDDMVQVALDGVEATWLDDDDKRALRATIVIAAEELRPTIHLT
ncbi:adenosine deaminase [soil metagenome]